MNIKSRIEEIFKEGGVLSKFKDGYKERPIQIEAASKLYTSINDNNEKCFIMEGECGTGKSFAYIMPILDKIAQNGFSEKLIIVTSNISLQEQLAFRDVPFALKVLEEMYPDMPNTFKGVMFKGRQNFLCNQKMKDLIADSYVDGYDISSSPKFQEIQNWFYDTKNGDLSELSFIPDQSVLSNIACLEADECCGTKKCPSGGECFYARHKNKIYGAGVIITNYHMLFTNLNVGETLLPPYDYIVFDECHELANIYRDYMTTSLSAGTISWISKKVKEMIKKDPQSLGYYENVLDPLKLLSLTQDYLSKINSTYSKSQYDQIMIIDNLDMSKAPDNFDLINHLNSFSATLSNIKDNLLSKMQYEEDDDAVASLSKAYSIADTLDEKISEILNIVECFSKDFEISDDYIQWIEINKEKGVSLNQKPLSVAKNMLENFYNKESLKCVFASATISVGGSMDYFKSQVGVDLLDNNLSSYFIGGSPFNMKEQQLWYLPKDAVEGNKVAEFNNKLPVHVSELIKACRGGALVLFTSYKNMKDTYDNIRFDMPRNIKLLKQGDAPRMKLLDEFSEDENSVLFATKSFFTGVDVPGKSLRCLIVDKLPFPQPTDPVQQKLSSQTDSFFKYSIPEMIITLKQAVGRGVRSIDDKCVIAILDNRMATARYKVRISKSFNYEKTATRDLSTVEEFIDNYIGKDNNEIKDMNDYLKELEYIPDEMPF